MEQYNGTVWNSITYLQELNMFRPLTEDEETWLNTVGQQITCGMCDLTFANAYQLRNHQQVYDKLVCQGLWTGKRKRFLNEIKVFRPLSTEEHELLEILGQTYTCEVCDEKFETTSRLKRHIERYSKVEPITYLDSSTGKQEIRTKVKCVECDRLFRSEFLLRCHKNNYHDHPCEECSLKFQTKSQLSHHKDRSHATNIKPAKDG